MPVCPAVSPIVPNTSEFEAQDLSGHEDSMIRVARDAPAREDASGNDGRDPQVAQRPRGGLHQESQLLKNMPGIC